MPDLQYNLGPTPVFDGDDVLRYFIRWHERDPRPLSAWCHYVRGRSGREDGYYLHHAKSGLVFRFGDDYGRWDTQWELMRRLRLWVSSYRNLHIK